MASAEELEWKKANGNPLKRVMPMLAGIALAAVLGGTTFAGVYALGARDAQNEAREQEQGLERYCYDGHSYHRGDCNQGTTGLLMIAAPAVASLLGFAIGFALGGGKISQRYFQGLN
jgi:hypothetical protein